MSPQRAILATNSISMLRLKEKCRSWGIYQNTPLSSETTPKHQSSTDSVEHRAPLSPAQESLDKIPKDGLR
jgi:DNA polymerase III psi subunit